MAQTFTIAKKNYTVGTSTDQSALSGSSISTISATANVTSITQPCTVQITINYSTDGGTTWHPLLTVPVASLPGTNTDDNTPITDIGANSQFYPPIAPTSIQRVVTVTGHSAQIGPDTITVN